MVLAGAGSWIAERAATALAGETVLLPFANGERTREPGILVGGEARISSRAKVLVEAWKLPGVNEVPAIFGLRFFGSRLSADFGLMRVLGVSTGGWPYFPWVDFVVSW